MKTTKGNPAMSNLAQTRAAALHAHKYKETKERVETTRRELLENLQKTYGESWQTLKQQSLGELWRKYVTNKSDAEAFMEVMYPSLTKPMQLAYVHMFERAVRGEIKLDEQLIYKESDKAKDQWDPLAEMEQEKIKGQMNLTKKRMEELLLEEEKVSK